LTWAYEITKYPQSATFCGHAHARPRVPGPPTGTGKTRTAADVVRRGVAHGRRSLWLAHRTELIDQSASVLAGLGLDVGVISAASSMRARADALVQVASIQTLLARDHRPPADLIVWDECHHGPAEEWSGLLSAYPKRKRRSG